MPGSKTPKKLGGHFAKKERRREVLSSHRFVPKVFNGARQKGDGAQLDRVVVQVRGVEMGASFTIRACKKRRALF